MQVKLSFKYLIIFVYADFTLSILLNYNLTHAQCNLSQSFKHYFIIYKIPVLLAY